MVIACMNIKDPISLEIQFFVVAAADMGEESEQNLAGR